MKGLVYQEPYLAHSTSWFHNSDKPWPSACQMAAWEGFKPGSVNIDWVFDLEQDLMTHLESEYQMVLVPWRCEDSTGQDVECRAQP